MAKEPTSYIWTFGREKKIHRVTQMSEKRLKKIPTLEEKWKPGKTSEQGTPCCRKEAGTTS